MPTREEYIDRLRLPIIHPEYIDPMSIRIPLTTSTGLLIAHTYSRIVIGSRGPYMEFTLPMLAKDTFVIPEDQRWRLEDPRAYYVEYRTVDSASVKIYYQRKLVYYADYRIDRFYISPFDLVMADTGEFVIDSLRKRGV